ncbi:MAG: CCA tRNA nucleotidyltransferase [Treponema sp.]|jgi:putative nucleotidyltransferase with HDIG domain|nr:CCA tRNA nucleotidyltransferase [Treponema sp.]
MHIHIDPILKEVSSIFSRNGKEVCLVGGAVRDILLGKKASDWDLASNASPEDVIRFFKYVIPTGIKHGTVTILYKGKSIEVTTYRTESDYSDGRHPDNVEYAATIEEDLSRRDFTMNAIASKLPNGELIDPFNGQIDIKKQIIRCVGNPDERFSEDGLRPIRAVRFASQLQFLLDASTLQAIPGALEKTAKVAPERIQQELNKILMSGQPSTAFRLMEETRLLSLILPELAYCRGIDQKGYHKFDVIDHLLLACDAAAAEETSLTVRLAALFHDIGKPATRRMGDSGVWTFYNHERESSKITRKILSRLRYPNNTIDAVCHLIEQHMFHYEDIWSDAAVRRFIIRVGEEHINDLFALRRADTFGTEAKPVDPRSLLPFQDRLEKILSQAKIQSLKDLSVTGKDLIDMGIPSGKQIGIILNELLEAVIDDPELNTRDKLLEIAGNIAQFHTR